MSKTSLFIFCIIVSHYLQAQQGFPVNGVNDKRPRLYAYTNATIVTSPNNTINNGVLLVRDGIVENVGVGIAIPPDAVVYDVAGLYIYPSFIDVYSNYGVPRNAPKSPAQANGLVPRDGAFAWNDVLRAEYNAVTDFRANDTTANPLRQQGFGTVLTFRPDGIIRGTAALVSLANTSEQESVLKASAAVMYSFNRGTSNMDYPSSLMGSVALLRQAYFDAQWYAATGYKQQFNATLKAMNEQNTLPQIIETSNKINALLAARVGEEQKIKYIIKGTGDEYQRLAELKKTGATFIVPLNFPQAYDVSNPYDALNVSLAQMKHWELAPYNTARLAAAGVPFCITSAGLKNQSDFLKNLRLAVRCGLSETDALKALTVTPAQIVNMADKLGTLEKGKIANFVITSGSIFNEQTVIYQNIVQGYVYEYADVQAPNLAGKYKVLINKEYKMNISGKQGQYKWELVENDTVKTPVTANLKNDVFTLSFRFPKDSMGVTRVTAWLQNKNIIGNATLSDGSAANFSATYLEPLTDTTKTVATKQLADTGSVLFPFGSYGWTKKPAQQTILFRNATVWTSEDDGILPNTDVLVQNGKIAQIGKNLSDKGATVVDATGKHLTAGIIDEHSHIALFSVNEGSQTSSAEVRMADAISPEDVNIYRQLSGGVTAAQLLHGSANAIGGQSALIKLRWGSAPAEMLIDKADGFIKFALGENVKQSNWGAQSNYRFPQTRMGVEQVYVDAFTRANEYITEWDNFKKGQTKIAPRRDLELETLAEILQKKRFITCHSYVQSEINMLMHVADTFGFKINTFTHILEGYKVADKMKKHGVAASTFADWWAYKYEVREAIPYNAALMTQVGIPVAINSDDAEMGRRLNQEAAKTVKYGGMTEHEAWCMTTINPARMLHLDQRMGSIKAGKDADLVLWSDNPLSIYAKVEKTLIDGTVYYDTDTDKAMRQYITSERNRLMQKMINAANSGAPLQITVPQTPRVWHCDDMGDDSGM